MVVTQQMLDEAWTAYRGLMIGGAIAELTDQNGEKLRFTPAKKGDLLNYIRFLEMKLGIAQPSSGPMRVWF